MSNTDIFILPYLTSEEYNEFFPTEESRQMLQRRQTQMQTDVINRQQNLLSTDSKTCYQPTAKPVINRYFW